MSIETGKFISVETKIDLPYENFNCGLDSLAISWFSVTQNGFNGDPIGFFALLNLEEIIEND